MGKPALVMRNVTERPGAVLSGTAKLVGTRFKGIVENVAALLTRPDICSAMSQNNDPYGDGCASDRIVQIINHALP